MTATAIHLYEATDAIEIVRKWIFEHDEELRANEGVLPDELAELLSHVEGTFDQKAERVALFIREMRATVTAIKEEEARIVKRRRAMENAADRMQRYLETNMLEAERPRIEGKLVTLRIQLNNPAVHCEFDSDSLKELYPRASMAFPFIRRVPESYVLDKKVCLEMHKLGIELPDGIDVERGASLRIV